MDNEMIPAYVAFFVFGLLGRMTKEKYLKNLIVSLNNYRIFKLDPEVTVRLIKIFSIGILVVGVLGILSSIFKWNSY